MQAMEWRAEQPLIGLSVVIPVRDSRHDLAACLRSLTFSSVAPAEVIVVDDGSRDGSAGVAREYGARLLRFPESRGPAVARNAGARAARQPVLMFLDADVTVHRDTLERAYRTLTSSTAGAVFGAYDDAPLAPGLVSRYRNLLHHFTHLTGRRNASTFWAGCGIIRRNVFLLHGGFDENRRQPSVEDIELGGRLLRAGVEVQLVPDIQVRHAKSWTLWSMVRTDVALRAWPWSRLLLHQGCLPDDLNLRWNQRAGALFAWLTAGFSGAACFSRAAVVGIVLSAAGAGLANRRFLGFLARVAGPGFAVRAFPLHLLFLLYSSATFAVACLAELSPSVARVFDRKRRPGTAEISGLQPDPPPLVPEG
jgi:glycosyltransferase involved in cell wall biosynthesis